MILRNDAPSRAQRPDGAAPWDPTSPAAAGPPGREGRRARSVTYGLVLTLLLTATVQAEFWPLTAYRLFSAVRTGTTVTLDLVAETPDGDVTVRPADRAAVLTTTTSQYQDLAAATPERRHAMVVSWLTLAELDAADVSTVRLERTVRTLTPGTDRWVEQSRTTLLEVTP